MKQLVTAWFIEYYPRKNEKMIYKFLTVNNKFFLFYI